MNLNKKDQKILEYLKLITSELTDLTIQHPTSENSDAYRYARFS